MTTPYKIHYAEIEGLFVSQGDSFYTGNVVYTNRIYENVPPNVVDDLDSGVSVSTGLGALPSLPIKVEPFKATESFSSLTLSIAATPDRISKYLRKQQAADAVLETAIPENDLTPTAIDIAAVLEVDDLVYIGESTYKTTAVNSSGTSSGNYDLEELTSKELAYPVGEPVYTNAPPFFNGRRVEVGLFFSDGRTSQSKWVGRISGEITFDGSTIYIPCKSVFSGLDSVTVGNSIQRYSIPAISSFGVNAAELVAQTEDGTTHDRIRKENIQTTEDITTGFVRIKDSLFPYVNDKNNDSINNRIIEIPLLGSPALEIEDDENLDDIIATSVFVVSKTIDNAGLFGPAALPASSTRDLADVTYANAEVYPYHPVAIFAAFVLSTKSTTTDPDAFDIFDRNFALDMRWAFDVSSFIEDVKNLINETPSYQVKRMVLHFDRKPIEIFKELRKLLRAYGFFIGTDKNGKLTVRQAEIPSILTVDDALSNNILDRTLLQSDIQQTSGTGNVTDSLSVIVGQLPWDDGTAYSIESGNKVPERASQFIRQNEFSLDIPYENKDSFASLLASLVSRSNLQSYALPRVKMEVSDQKDQINGDLDYGIGTFVALQDLPLKKALLVDREGNFIKDVSGRNLYGLIIHNEYSPSSNTYFLTMQVSFSEPARLRAPAGIVQSTASVGSTFTIVLGDDFGTLDGKDATEFNKLDQIQAYNTDGTQASTTLFTITEEPETDGANTLTVNTDPTTDVGVGDIIRLANIDTDDSNDGYFNPDVLANYDRKYVFMSSTDRELGDNNDDGDIYG